MRNQIMRFVLIALFSAYILSCNNTSTKNTTNAESDSILKSSIENTNLTTKLETSSEIKTDSSELTTLIRNLYKWHEIGVNNMNSRLLDFPTTTKDSFFTGIDWFAHKERMVELEKTNYFSKEFLEIYNKIAVQIDSFIVNSKTKYETNLIPPFDTDADDWCGCQWSPDNYWELVTIHDFVNYGDSATFKWDWTPSRRELYFVKAKKENGIWKISYLEGFKSRNYLYNMK